MKNAILNETYELLREMKVVKNQSEFSREWLGKSDSYMRMLKFKDIEASTSCLTICGINLENYGKKMIETPITKETGKRFLQLSEQCIHWIKERARKTSPLTQLYTNNHNPIAKHVLYATTPNGQNILDNPDKIYRCRGYVWPSQLKAHMKEDKIQNFIYALLLKNIPGVLEEIINIGMHTGDDNRAYRKVGHAPGWNKGQITGPNGMDMLHTIIPATEREFPNINVHKDNLEVLVWNTTHLRGHRFKYCPTRESEKTICDAFLAKYGRLPVGNIQNPNTRNKIHGTEIDHFNSLFEIKD